MPFKSEKQKRFMYAKHPEIAKRWEKEGKGSVVSTQKATPVKKSGGPKAPAKKNMKPVNKVTSPATRGKALPPHVLKAQTSTTRKNYKRGK